MMRRIFLFGSLFFLAGGIARAEILTLFSDKGLPDIPPNTVPTYSGGGLYTEGHWQAIVPPEGFESWKTTQTVNSFAGWGLAYAVPQNLSRFNSGEMRFWINSSIGNIQIEIKNP